MRFQVPQFIDVEDKIFGPLTFRQFIYLVGGAGLCYVIFKLLPIYISLFLVIGVAALAGALAFVKINGKPFINLLEAGFNYLVHDKLYVWKKAMEKKSASPEKAAAEILAKKKIQYVPMMSESKLHDISWGLDVLDSKNTGQR